MTTRNVIFIFLLSLPRHTSMIDLIVHRPLDGVVELRPDEAVADRHPHGRSHRAGEPILLERRPVLRRDEIEAVASEACGFAACRRTTSWCRRRTRRASAPA